MPENRGKISLEDLIQLKRSERPSDEFWEDFEKELVLKQRLLSQDQPVSKAIFAAAFWANTKRVFAYSGAAASTAAFLFAGYIGLNSMQTASEEVEPNIKQAMPTFAVAKEVSGIETKQQKPIGELELNQPEEQLASHHSIQSPNLSTTAVTQTASTRPSQTLDLADFDAEAYALTRPLEGLDIEQIVNLRESHANSSPMSLDLRDKYLEPVGYYSKGKNTSAQSNPQIQYARIESKMFSSNSRQSSRFSEITLKF